MSLRSQPSLAAYQSSAQVLIPKERVPAVALSGGVLQLGRADRAIAAGDIPAAHEALITAQQIVGLLRGALDHTAGGAVATGLDRVYAYLQAELGRANVEKSRPRLEGLLRLLPPLVEAWEGAAAAVLQGRGAPARNGGLAG